MRETFKLIVVAELALVLATGCEETVPSQSDSNRATIGADGGTIASTDERLRLEVPAGALTESTEIGIRTVTSNESAPKLTYELTPEGLQFDVPAMITIEVDEFVEAGGEGERGIPFVSMTDAQGNNPEVARNHALMLDTESGEATLEAEINHFSTMTVDYSGIDVFVSSIPLTHPANTALPPVTVRIRSSYIYVDVNNPIYQDTSVGELFLVGENPVTLPDSGDTGLTETIVSYTCGDVGLGEYYATIDFTMQYQWERFAQLIGEESGQSVGGFTGNNVFGGNATVSDVSGDSETSPSDESMTSYDISIVATAFVQCQADTGDNGNGGSGVDPGQSDKSQGTYIGNGACQIGSMTLGVTGEGNITIEPLGSENFGPSTFEPQDGSDDTYDSVRTDLSFFGNGGHSCTLTCGPGEFDITVECTGPDGSCMETLTFQGF